MAITNTMESLRTRSDRLIRKGLDGGIFVKRFIEGDDEVESIFDAEGLILPEDYIDVGHLTKDQGVAWSREIDTSDVDSLGIAEPTRRDITSDVTGLEFTMQESKAQVIELYEGIDLSAVAATAAGDSHSTFYYDKADRPATIYYRAFVLFKDGEGDEAFYFAKWLPKCQVTDRSEQTWNEEEELQYGVTMTAFNDAEFGTAVRSLWAVPTARVADMGVTA